MRQNDMLLHRPPFYTISVANKALLVLLAGYLILEAIELLVYFLTGQIITTEQYIILSLLVDVPVLLMAFLTVQPIPALRFRKPSAANVAYTLLLVFFSYLALGALLNLISGGIEASGGEVPTDVVAEVMDGQPFILEFLLYCVFAPLTEEILFRGMIQNAYERKVGFWAFVISGVLFGAIHADPLSMLNAALLGFVMGLLYLRTRSIWCPIIFHGLYNLLAFSPEASLIPDAILVFPWAAEWLPLETMNVSQPFYVLYLVVVGAVSAVVVLALLRRLFYANPENTSAQVKPYTPWRGEKSTLVWAVVMLSIRAFPFILAYF